MLRALFNVTYEIVTHESAELGDADERGFISQSVGLREAVKDFRQTRTSMCDGVIDLYANASSGRPHWITVNNGMEFHTGAYESRSLHIPCTVSDSSAKRIARLLGA